MKILFVSEYFYPRIAGGEKWSFELCKELVKQGHKVTVVTSKFDDNTKNETIYSIKIIRFDKTGDLSSIFQRIKFMFKLKIYLVELLKKEKFDVIHSLAYISNIAASFAAKKNKIRCITSVHSYFGLNWFRITNPLFALINFISEKIVILMDRSDMIQVPSKYVYDKLWFVSNSRKKVIYNFVDLDEDLKKSELKENSVNIRKKYDIKKNELFFVSIGNLQKIKNFDGLIKKIKDFDKPFKLFIIGEGKEREKLEKLINKYRLKEKVFLIGNLDKPTVLNFMKKADYIAVSSYSESFSYVLAEGLILKKKIICFKKIGIYEDYEDIMINLNNINDLSDKMVLKTLTNNPFLKDKIIKDFENLYKV